jgi:predicted dehydrogenase
MNVGIIGLGVGHQHLKSLYNSKNIEKIFIHDFDKELMISLSAKYNAYMVDSFKQLVNQNIELLVIASFDNYHAEQIRIAFQKNINVFIEKPLCLNNNELKLIMDDFYDSQSQLSCNFILRKERRFEILKNNIKNGLLGEIYQVEGSYDYGRFYKIKSGWRGKIPYYSVFHGGAIHLIDLFGWLLKSNFSPEFVLGTNAAIKGDEELEKSVRYDNILAVGKFKNNIIGRISSNYCTTSKHYHQIRIYGTLGIFSHEFGRCFYSFGDDRDNDIQYDTHDFPSSGKGDYLIDFVHHLLGYEKDIITAEEVFEVMKTSINVEDLLLKEV